MFEIFVEPIFTSTLDRVANKGRTPTSEDATDALCLSNLFPCFPVAFVEVRINLTTTFDQVKGSDGRMCRALTCYQYHKHSIDFHGRLTQARIPPTVHAA